MISTTTVIAANVGTIRFLFFMESSGVTEFLGTVRGYYEGGFGCVTNLPTGCISAQVASLVGVATL
jgi:hypothetical protein